MHEVMNSIELMKYVYLNI